MFVLRALWSFLGKELWDFWLAFIITVMLALTWAAFTPVSPPVLYAPF